MYRKRKKKFFFLGGGGDVHISSAEQTSQLCIDLQMVPKNKYLLREIYNPHRVRNFAHSICLRKCVGKEK